MALLTFENLQQATKYETSEQIRAHLDKNNIKYWLGKHNRPYTFESCYTHFIKDQTRSTNTNPFVEI